MGRHIVGALVIVAALLASTIAVTDGLLLIRYCASPSGSNAAFHEAAAPISVVMPAYNAEGRIVSSALSVLASKGVAVELIVVNDGSTDGTLDLISGISGVTIVNMPHAGKWAALNAGIARATHDHVATVDADTILDNSALQILSRALGTADAVAGCLLVANGDSVIGDLQAQEHLRIAAYRRIAGSVDTISGPVAAFRKAVLVRIPFSPSPVEDFEHTVLLREAGARIAYAPDAKAYTHMPDTIGDYLRQRVRWSRGTLMAMRRHNIPHRSLARGYALALIDVLVVPTCLVTGLYAPLVVLTVLEGGIQVLIKRKEGAPRYGGAPTFFVQLVVLAALVLATSAYARLTFRRYEIKSGQESENAASTLK